MLEVIDRGQATEAHPTPLLFVHGGFHGAWCWDEHFLSYFAEKGYRAIAPSVRGHGRSATTKPLKSCTIADYVDDLAEIVESLPTTPVLLGHSMGGFIIQKYLETHSAPAAVLMASGPPAGHLNTLLRLTRRHPWRAARATLTGRPSMLFNTVELARGSLFTRDTPETIVVRTHRRLAEESPRVILGDMAFLDRVKVASVDTPMLVLGAERDALYDHAAVQATAAAYHTQSQLVPGSGHDLMLDTRWADAAQRIDQWLVERNL